MNSSIGISPDWIEKMFADNGLSVSGDEILARLKGRLFSHKEIIIFLGSDKEKIVLF